jgi:peptidoglycan/xylan/chitin deacetylase (PgdA/CDA1 family)
MVLNVVWASEPVTSNTNVPKACDKPLYLTFDTGHMGVAPLIAQVLERHQVRVTFFVADEPAQTGGSSLGQAWQPWWRDRALEGHQFASHTLDHVYWLADLPHSKGFRVKPSAGAHTGQVMNFTAAQYCQALEGAAQRIEQFTGKAALALFRAPGGKTSAQLIASARACGFDHVGWSDAGFLGDELPSQAFPNALLLKKALDHIRAGDILMAHLGIWSRQDPWAPAVLEPLVQGLLQQGFCFKTLEEHPRYRAWIAQHARTPPTPFTHLSPKSRATPSQGSS